VVGRVKSFRHCPEEDKAARAVVFGLLAEMERQQP
jgi:hypothetical protein